MSDNPHQEAIKGFDNDEQFYSAIGRFISEFSYLEFILKFRIAKAVGLNEEFSEQIMSHDFALLCTIAQNVMCRGEDGERAAEISQLIAKCRELNNHRLRIVHGQWAIGRRTGRVVHVSRQKLELSEHYHSSNEVARLADDARMLTGMLLVVGD